MKFFTVFFVIILIMGCAQRSKEIRYTYCPDPVMIPDCVKYGDIGSICFQKWIERQQEVNNQLAAGQKWRWQHMERGQ